jgi:aminoglycoside phosphotransferase (APT) family kinase protein
VATGFSNETVLFTVSWVENGEAHTDRLVGRLEPPDGAMFPDQVPGLESSCYLQHRVMAVVAEQTAAPIPQLFGYEHELEPFGRSFFAMGFVEGEVPADNPRYSQSGFLVETSSPSERRRLVESGLQAMAEIHGIDWRTSGLTWLDPSGMGQPTQADQIRIWRSYVERELRDRDHPVLTHALDWVEANDPHDERVGLSWGDARIGNVIWQDHQAGAVLDWEACALLPTEADVGWWLMFDRMSFEDMGAPRMDGYPTREEMIAFYEAASGREVRDPHYWEVFGAMRFCAIFVRLGDRFVNAGLMPDDANPAIPNMVTASLAALLDIENPTPSIL